MDNGPPRYDEVVQLDDLCTPTAPLLQPHTSGLTSLDLALYSLPPTVTVGLSPDDSTTFYIRDVNSCVVIKGVLTPGNISLCNANGGNVMNIQSNRISIDEEVKAKHVQKSTIVHGRHRLGTVECKEFDLNRLSTSNLFEKYDFFINCMGETEKDIVMSRSRTSPPLCQAHIAACSGGEGSTSFDAKLVFPSDSLATKIEQCLCIATVITFIIARNSVSKEKHSEAQCGAYILCFIICVIIGILGFIFITWLQAEECRRKPYRCKKN